LSLSNLKVIYRKNVTLPLAKRHFHQHQGERWEFPGGKLEIGESPIDALKRELKEEINITVLSADTFTTLERHYPDKSVCLHFFIVTAFDGEPSHQEGQEICWVSKAALSDYEFPDANRSIVALLL